MPFQRPHGCRAHAGRRLAHCAGGRRRARPAPRRGPGGVRGGPGARGAAGRDRRPQARRARSSPELAMGAVGEDGVLVVNEDVVRLAGVDRRELAAVERRERAELERRALRFRGDRPRVPLEGRTAVVVDDGIATGATARAAVPGRAGARARRGWCWRCRSARRESAPGSRRRSTRWSCLETPRTFAAVGQAYAGLPADRRRARSSSCCEPRRPATGADRPARAPLRRGGRRSRPGRCGWPGTSPCPEHAGGLVVFAHGSGSSRHSPRNRYVAGVLQRGRAGARCCSTC